MEILLATGNRHKVQEIQAILSTLPFTWRTTSDWPNATEVSEFGSTYEENAILKARTWSERTEMWTLSDDSGIEVEALKGRPGLRSARYAKYGEDPIVKMLGELENVPESGRKARFVCVACLSAPHGEVYTTTGILNGRIGFEPRGQLGFGYDPIFIPEGYEGQHLAELSTSIKNNISHRSRALRQLEPHFKVLLEG